jgi:hypothetical protein
LKISCEADQYYCVGRDVLAKRRSKICIFLAGKTVPSAPWVSAASNAGCTDTTWRGVAKKINFLKRERRSGKPEAIGLALVRQLILNALHRAGVSASDLPETTTHSNAQSRLP